MESYSPNRGRMATRLLARSCPTAEAIESRTSITRSHRHQQNLVPRDKHSIHQHPMFTHGATALLRRRGQSVSGRAVKRMGTNLVTAVLYHHPTRKQNFLKGQGGQEIYLAPLSPLSVLPASNPSSSRCFHTLSSRTPPFRLSPYSPALATVWEAEPTPPSLTSRSRLSTPTV